ncbi:PhnD/SsuA/transferrin family substrate-binding protein [Sulfitobacter albidus]|uniref:PhnD/SsuA/transferrin family substrate-binding protein n=1 Tax=Sulfitobacter albidus TaxID=2829501 RepID=A0A975JDM7_9RHOB|nr:PhnD/SsuA/transferrin family substrate-binding protein [Sulfitobacter albidus]QUJ76513.1 PhnD/SsuA/transferrin family substrate-binding protein [Sulfitobacter albidus]
MIANLMMYARPELEGAHARLWALIRARLGRRGIDAPENLAQDADPFTVWRAPDLVLSQTCGMPYRTALHGNVQLVGTPDYALPECPAGHYRSVIVAHTDSPADSARDLLGGTVAYNDALSQSGFAALYTHLGGDWFAVSVRSGGHVASARMVAERHADIAALDAQTWRLIRRYEPFARDLRVLEHTAPTPGLPLITAMGQDTDAIFDAVESAIAALAPEYANLLDLRGLIRIPTAEYLAVQTPPPAVI